MVKYFNRKAIISLLLTGTIVMTASSCGAKIVNMPSNSIATTNMEQTLNSYDSIETIIEEDIEKQVAPEGSTKCSAVKVLGSHQKDGKANEYDAMIALGTFHKEIFQGEVFTIENKDTSRVDLVTVEFNDNQIANYIPCVEDLDHSTDQSAVSTLIQNNFSEESIATLRSNSSLKDELVKEKYMNAIGVASYITTADNFKKIVTTGTGVCIDQDGNTTRIEPKEDSKSLN
jgi:hypothetical protein